MEERIIIGVAINKAGTIYSLLRPNRHHNVIKYMVDLGVSPKGEDAIQGFIDNNGLFLEREEAKKLALTNNQFRKESTTPDSPWLFSEDLW